MTLQAQWHISLMWRKDKPKRDKYNYTKNSVKTQKPKKDSYRNGNTDTSNREEKVREKNKRPTGKVRYNYSGTETKINVLYAASQRRKCRPITQRGKKTHNRWHRKD